MKMQNGAGLKILGTLINSTVSIINTNFCYMIIMIVKIIINNNININGILFNNRLSKFQRNSKKTLLKLSVYVNRLGAKPG